MNTTIAEHIHYERLSNGLDVALVPMHVHDVVKIHMQLGVGAHASDAHPALALLGTELMPGGGAGMKRRELREALERLGARMGVSIGATSTEVSIRCRRAVVHDVCTLAFSSLRTLQVTTREFNEARQRILSTLDNDEEDTTVRATIALSHALFKQQHPHYEPSLASLRTALLNATLPELKAYYTSLMSTLGGRVVVAGDLSVKTMTTILKETSSVLPAAAPSATHGKSVSALVKTPRDETIIPIRHKMNIDTCYALPLSITRDADEFLALSLGVGILGSSSTGRLFNELRTRRSLTYGSYATLTGTTGGYPALLKAYGIFPNNLFVPGRAALRDVVDRWVEGGVTSAEVTRHKTEVLGRYTVGLITTGGMARAVLATLELGKSPEYLDEYPAEIAALGRREVNDAISTFVQGAPRALVAAGAITETGSVL